MKSVKNIEKITKAMKMVAASKMRGVQSKMEQARGFPLPFIKLLGDLPGERSVRRLHVMHRNNRYHV